MRKHLRAMSNMVRELKSVGENISDEDQVQAVIRSQPTTPEWREMKRTRTHNDNIKFFDDISRHLELEEERLEDERLSGQVYVAESGSRKAFGFKRKKGGSPKKKGLGPTSNNTKMNQPKATVLIRKRAK